MALRTGASEHVVPYAYVCVTCRVPALRGGLPRYSSPKTRLSSPARNPETAQLSTHNSHVDSVSYQS